MTLCLFGARLFISIAMMRVGWSPFSAHFIAAVRQSASDSVVVKGLISESHPLTTQNLSTGDFLEAIPHSDTLQNCFKQFYIQTLNRCFFVIMKKKTFDVHISTNPAMIYSRCFKNSPNLQILWFGAVRWRGTDGQKRKRQAKTRSYFNTTNIRQIKISISIFAHWNAA